MDARNAYARWRTIENGAVRADPLFQSALDASGGRSVMVPEKLQHLFLLIRDELGALAAQNIVEFGSYKGGSALFMAYVLKYTHPDAIIYSLDTFTGMPETNPAIDAHGPGGFSDADLEGFRARADALRLTNLHIVPGLIQSTFPKIAGARFGLAHIDVDIYSAVKFAQDAAWGALVPGGWIVYDDANAPSCIGATRAAEELVMAHHVHSEQIWPHWVFRR